MAPLTTAALVVPLSRRLGLGSILGTLAGGAAIGPSGLGLITDVADIAGLAEFGVVGRILHMRGIRFTALEHDPSQVEVVWRFGNAVYYGDPTRPDLLRAAGAGRAHLRGATAACWSSPWMRGSKVSDR